MTAPPDAPEPTPAPLPPFKFHDDTIKGSERFNDLLKTEYERRAGKVKLAEDRARANGTAALAVVTAMTVLRSLTPDQPAWAALVFLLLVVVSLVLMATIVANRDGTGITTAALIKERNHLWAEGRTYMEIMQFYQLGMIQNIEELERTQHLKYRLLDWQNACLFAQIVLLAVMLVFSGFSLH